MSKRLAIIEVPVAQKTFEAFLPLHLTGFEVLGLLTRIAGDLTDGIFVPGDDAALCRKDDGAMLDLSMPIWKLDIKNGDKLVLI